MIHKIQMKNGKSRRNEEETCGETATSENHTSGKLTSGMSRAVLAGGADALRVTLTLVSAERRLLRVGAVSGGRLVVVSAVAILLATRKTRKLK